MKRNDERIIAVLFYPGMSALEIVGTMQSMKLLQVRGPYRLVTVAESLEPVQTDTALKMVPNKRLSEVQHPFGLLVPGGDDAALAAGQNDEVRRYVQSVAERASLVASIGTGALILAQAGLLDGRQATTHWAYQQQLEEFGARYTRRRWVEDGKFVTAAGVTAGIDLGLYLVGKLSSISKARSAQLVIEYDPQPPFGGIDWERVDRDVAVTTTVAGEPNSRRSGDAIKKASVR